MGYFQVRTVSFSEGRIQGSPCPLARSLPRNCFNFFNGPNSMYIFVWKLNCAGTTSCLFHPFEIPIKITAAFLGYKQQFINIISSNDSMTYERCWASSPPFLVKTLGGTVNHGKLAVNLAKMGENSANKNMSDITLPETKSKSTWK